MKNVVRFFLRSRVLKHRERTFPSHRSVPKFAPRVTFDPRKGADDNKMATNPNQGGKKLVRSKSGLRMVAANSAFRSPFELEEPPWVPDSECSQCMSCKAKFDFVKRKHHCRRCGKCYCDKCCQHKVALPRLCFLDPVRLCYDCAVITQKENEFYDKQLKVLLHGAAFQLSCPDDMENLSEPCLCKLSTDHRFLMFESAGHAKHSPVELEQVVAIQILTAGEDSQGNIVANGLSIKHKERESGEIRHLQLIISATTDNRKQSLAFVGAVQKGVKFMYEAKESRGL
ncbi:zinc finger FYVE domain-containing protein 21-like isoform X2 [Branchiostoma floridae]|uniref:Zinc finger FYVE domain-containing protein 21-like isoform X2 n=2 Tax=Branchiostoma floridae TaxID=7739 RepID=A0A9J7L5W3_BRAFL|nr:zinc finger FYVE domain-containing protein 21-like isoform X2 [Branchiostoma floridae]